MKRVRSTLTYANVMATLALFLALSGGVYAASTLGKNSVKSKNIAAKAVKARNLARNAVKAGALAPNAVTTGKIRAGAISAGKVKKGTLTRKTMATGTLPGLIVAEAQATSVPGLTAETTTGTSVPLTGSLAFTPESGKAYELLTELSGTPSDSDGSGPSVCSPFVSVQVNGVPISGAGLWANAKGTPPFNFEPVGSSSTAIGLQAAGQQQTLSVLSYGSTGCGSSTSGALRVVVIELG